MTDLCVAHLELPVRLTSGVRCSECDPAIEIRLLRTVLTNDQSGCARAVPVTMTVNYNPYQAVAIKVDGEVSLSNFSQPQAICATKVDRQVQFETMPLPSMARKVAFSLEWPGLAIVPIGLDLSPCTIGSTKVWSGAERPRF